MTPTDLPDLERLAADALAALEARNRSYQRSLDPSMPESRPLVPEWIGLMIDARIAMSRFTLAYATSLLQGGRPTAPILTAWAAVEQEAQALSVDDPDAPAQAPRCRARRAHRSGAERMAVTTLPRRGRGKSARNLELIEAAYDILARIQPASVRAVCYQLFNAKLIPDMGKNSTGRVSKQLTWARENGDIPWHWIVDETRAIERRATWDDPSRILEAAARGYRRDWWEQQESRVIVASEKATVAGTIRPVTSEYGVGFVALHGYSSASLVHEIAETSMDDDRPLILLYVGDWDPSGMHMSEVDLSDRIDRYDGDAEVRRIALSREDTASLGHGLSFSAHDKARDARYGWFVSRYGDRCWELDALDPNILRERIEEAIHEYIDWDEWQRCLKVEEQERQSLRDVVDSWKKALKKDPS